MIKQKLVVVGNGMAGMRAVEELLKIAFRQAGKTAIFDESTGEQVPVCTAKATKASIAVSFK